jgi:transcriptional regulator NrdR family protein
MENSIMPKTVIKKDGRKESFIKEKIVVSAIKTGAPLKVARDIAEKIERVPKEEIKTIEIRKSVLDRLKLHNPDLPKRWYNYDKNVKRLHKYMY